MSLIDQATSERSRNKMFSETAGTRNEPKKIIQASELLSIMRSVFDDEMLDKKTKKEWSGYRRKLKTARWTLAGTLNAVHEELWSSMMTATMAAMQKEINNSQPNGEWKLYDYEVDIRTGKDNVQAIILAADWVDSRNEQDLRYTNGVPAVDVHVDVSNSNKELIEALTSRQNSSNDDELKDLMKQFIAAMAGKAIEDTKEAKPRKQTAKAQPKNDIEDIAENFDG
tara:strand:+ start:5953 stop:6630 length:678 start_codon:yes stop_codon:yes gene_type:complete